MRSEGEDNDFRAIGELQYSKFSHGSEGFNAYSVVPVRVQYSTVSYGSEGKYFVNFHNYLLQYSKFSHGSEGLSSIDSDGSEKLNFIYDIIDSLFTCFF